MYALTMYYLISVWQAWVIMYTWEVQHIIDAAIAAQVWWITTRALCVVDYHKSCSSSVVDHHMSSEQTFIPPDPP